MSSERVKEGIRGRRVVVFTCDECGDTFDTGREDFKEAVQAIKDDGWKFKKGDDGEWEHNCSQCS